MIGPAGFQQAPQPVEEKSAFFKAGAEARKRGQKLTESALTHIHPASRQYAEFIAGYDSPQEGVKKPRAPKAPKSHE